MSPRPVLPLLLLLPLAGLRTVTSDAVGEVRDERGRPVAGAVVRVPGRSAFTLTDPRGAFRLPDAGSGRVPAAKEGFVIAGASVRDAPLSLTLRPLPTTDCEAYRWVDP